MDTQQNMKRSHIAFVPFPFGSHVSIFYTLARQLADVAPGATFSLLSTPRSLASLHSSQNPKNLHLIEISNGISSDQQVPQNVVAQIELFLVSAPKSLSHGLKTAEQNAETELTCVTTDAFMWMAGEIAEKMGVTWVAVWTSASESLIAHLYTDEIRSAVQVEEPGHETKSLDFIPCLSKYLVSQLPEGIVTGNLNSRFAVTIHKMSHTLRRAKTVVVTTFEGLNPTVDETFTSKFASYLPIGPLHLLFPQSNDDSDILDDDPHPCITWLDKQDAESVVYIAFGTVATPPPHELIALAEGLDETNISFLWSINQKARANFPQGFVDRAEQTGRGFFVSWAPQLEVLRHVAVGLFVGHAGWNSVQESTFSGVPMVVRPFFGDHFLNARTVTHVLGIGVELEKGVFVKDEIVRLLSEILQGEKGERMREKAKKFKKFAFDARELNDGLMNVNFERLVRDFFKC